MGTWSNLGLKAEPKTKWKVVSKEEIEKKLAGLPSFVTCIRCGTTFKLNPGEEVKIPCPNCGAKE